MSDFRRRQMLAACESGSSPIIQVEWVQMWSRGVKWASMDFGATRPEESGYYVAWGETVGYSASQVGVDRVFSEDNYDYSAVTSSTIPSSNDIITITYGNGYRIPTQAEWQNLFSNTTRTYYNGYAVFTSKSNGNQLIFPYGGQCKAAGLEVYGVKAYYWTNSRGSGNQAWAIRFNESETQTGKSDARWVGKTIRGVKTI